MFARKIIKRRLAASLCPARRDHDIFNEVKIIDKLLDLNGWNKNVVQVFNHGWIQRDPNWYFIDLELCALNLEDYLQGDFKSVLGVSFYWDIVAIRNELGCLTIWSIMEDITSGLSFIHKCCAVHRDVKPANGTSAGKI